MGSTCSERTYGTISASPPNFLPSLLRKVSSFMIRIFITTLLAGTCALAQTSAAPPVQPLSRVPSIQQPVPPLPQQSFNPDTVASNAVVVTIHGVCPKDAASAKAGSAKEVSAKTGAPKSDSCQTVITKEQFNRMLAGMNLA